MPAWSQENGGPLSEAEIDDITAFVLTFRERPGALVEGEPAPQALAGNTTLWIVLGIVLFLLALGGIYFLTNRRQGT
jgi:hypothetical protein